jgi:hypothetical protein
MSEERELVEYIGSEAVDLCFRRVGRKEVRAFCVLISCWLYLRRPALSSPPLAIRRSCSSTDIICQNSVDDGR